MSKVDELPEWSTPAEVAARWRIHISTVYRMHHADPESFGRMFRGCLRIHRSSIEAEERTALQQQVAKATRNHRRQRHYQKPKDWIEFLVDC